MKTLEQIIKQSSSDRYEYPDIFSDTCGLDIVLPEKKLHAVKSWGHHKGNMKRRATLEVTTFKGVSFNAVHYYGKISIQGVDMEYNNKPGHSTMIFDKNLPLAHYDYELILRRPLTQAEIDNDPQRWGDYYHDGDLTNCFESIEDVLELAKEVFKMRFSGEWEFFVDSPFQSYNGRMEIDSI